MKKIVSFAVISTFLFLLCRLGFSQPIGQPAYPGRPGITPKQRIKANQGSSDEHVKEVLAMAGQQFIDFTLNGLTEGTTVHLANYKGKVILLDFSETYCPWCVKARPYLQKLNDDYKEKGIVILTISALWKNEDPEKDLKKEIEKENFTIPVALDPDGTVCKGYKVPGFPTFFLIDKKGVIRKVYVGAGEIMNGRIKTEIDALLEEELKEELKEKELEKEFE